MKKVLFLLLLLMVPFVSASFCPERCTGPRFFDCVEPADVEDGKMVIYVKNNFDHAIEMQPRYSGTGDCPVNGTISSLSTAFDTAYPLSENAYDEQTLPAVVEQGESMKIVFDCGELIQGRFKASVYFNYNAMHSGLPYTPEIALTTAIRTDHWSQRPELAEFQSDVKGFSSSQSRHSKLFFTYLLFFGLVVFTGYLLWPFLKMRPGYYALATVSSIFFWLYTLGMSSGGCYGPAMRREDWLLSPFGVYVVLLSIVLIAILWGYVLKWKDNIRERGWIVPIVSVLMLYAILVFNIGFDQVYSALVDFTFLLLMFFQNPWNYIIGGVLLFYRRQLHIGRKMILSIVLVSFVGGSLLGGLLGISAWGVSVLDTLWLNVFRNMLQPVIAGLILLFLRNRH